MKWLVNRQKILGYLGISAKAGKIVFGTESCIEKIEKKKVKLVIVAEDAARKNKEEF